MHGLINRSIQCFVRDTYGNETWARVAQQAGIGPQGFEAMLHYDDAVTFDLLTVLSRHLEKTESDLLEDVGTYLVSHPKTESVRRLLRFGGETFVDFLHSLDDLRDRVRLAVPDLDFPELELQNLEFGVFDLHVRDSRAEFGIVLCGALRALADDYGALVVLDPGTGEATGQCIRVTLLDAAFAQGRSFTLARQTETRPERSA